MRRVAFDLVVAAGFAACGAGSLPAVAAVTDSAPARLAAAEAVRPLPSSADVMLHFIQEDGPGSGHVRVILVPETRALTVLEARSAAQQAFLEALDEPGLGEKLSRITVVVRLMPASHPDPQASEQVIVFRHKGGRDWSVMAGE